jgi:O-Antigen ligase
MLYRQIEVFLVYVTIFVSSIVFFKEPFEGYLHYLIFLLFLPFFIIRFGFPKLPFQILFLPLIVGIMYIALGSNTWPQFLKIFIGVFLSSTFYYYVFHFYDMDVERLFKLYLKGCVIVAIIGLIQFLSYKIGFKLGYDYSFIFNKWGIVKNTQSGIRLNSIFSEASQLAIMLGPACFVAFHAIVFGERKFYNLLQSVIVIITLLLSTSSTGYFGLFVIAVLIGINYGKLVNVLFGIAILLTTSYMLYNYSPEFKSRIDSSKGLWIDGDFSLDNVNSSSFVLYNNYTVAINNFKKSPLFGTGLGSHQYAFEKYSLTSDKKFLDITFNKSDANSLFLRLLSETGLMGVIFMLIFIVKFFVKRKLDDSNNNYHWIISNSILVIILLYLLRQGNYFLNGFPFFMLLYYYNSVVYKLKIIENTNQSLE